MILRGAILSEERRAIIHGGADPDARSSGGENVSDAPKAIGVLAAALAETAAVVQSAPAPKRDEEVATERERPLSFEAVAAWLAVQDGQTREACASILSDELTQVHARAKAEGYAAGEAQGRAAGIGSLEEARSALAAVAASLERSFADEQARLGELCVDIVAEAFTQLAGPLLCSKEAAALVVSEVLTRVKEGRELSIRVHPADLRTLESEQAHLSVALAGRKLSLMADSRVETGGCIVESRFGGLDGRLDVQLRQLYDALQAAKAAQLESP